MQKVLIWGVIGAVAFQLTDTLLKRQTGSLSMGTAVWIYGGVPAALAGYALWRDGGTEATAVLAGALISFGVSSGIKDRALYAGSVTTT